jgi:hypothetical protein
LCHEQPPRKALLNVVQPIARCCLCNMQTVNYRIAAQHPSQVWGGFQSVFQSSKLHPKSIPRDLYHCLKRAPVQADSRGRSCKALFADHAGFGGSSIFHYDYKRNETSVREICKFHLSRLVKD